MIFNEVGEALPGFYVLGHYGVPAYLVDAPRPTVFDAGVSALGPAYLAHIQEFLGGREPQYLLLTHSHFDHLGAAAQIKAAYPGITIAASAKTAAVVERPNAIKLMALLNQQAADKYLEEDAGADLPGFEPFMVDRVLNDGDELDLGGGETARVLAAPGHTWDFLAFYLPRSKVLVASEAVGCLDNGGYIFTEFLVDYQAYLGSLERLAGLEVEGVCLGHRFVLTGEDAKAHFGRSLAAARTYYERVMGILDDNQGDVAATIDRVRREEWDTRPEPKQILQAYLLNTKARVEHLAQVWAQEHQA